MFRLFWPSKHNDQHPHLLRTSGIAFLAVAIVISNLVLPAQALAASNVTAEQLLVEHNEQRKLNGLPPLKINAALSNSAQRKAKAMLQSDCWSHYCPNGKSPWDFFADSGYNYRYAGENLAEGFDNIESVMIAWMNSPTHRENIVKAEYEEIGFGMVKGKFQGREDNLIITVHFGAPQPSIAKLVDNPANPLELPAPVITNPLPNSFISSPEVIISGVITEGSEVVLLQNEQEWTTTDAGQGIFTYQAENLPDKNYQISAKSRIGTRESAPSNKVNFTIDTTPDQIDLSQITLLNTPNQDQINIQVNAAGLASLRLSTESQGLSFVQQQGNIWELTLDTIDLSSQVFFNLQTKDLAGNTWEGNISTGNVLAQLSQIDFIQQDISSINRSSINLVFIIILLIIFSLDFSILRRSGLTKVESKGQLHLGLILVLLLITVVGGTAGQVLTGLSNY